MDLLEGQFEVDGVVFGIDCDVQVLEDGWHPGMGDWRTQDVDQPLGDGVTMGRDYQGGATWGFDLFTDSDSAAGARAAAARLKAVWPRTAVRLTPQSYVRLRYKVDTETRCIFGRPRRWTPTPDNRLYGGYLAITADFAAVDSLTYDDFEQTYGVKNTPILASHGLVSPMKSPIRTDYSAGESSGGLLVGGDARTWPVLRFTGGANPGVTIGDWKCKLQGSLSTNDTVVVDTRPWVRSSTINGALMPLAKDSRLQEMYLDPGAYTVTYEQDASASPGNVTVSWRNAHSSL